MLSGAVPVYIFLSGCLSTCLGQGGDNGLPPGFKLPDGIQLPEGFKLEDFEGMQIPEGFEIPEGIELPDGIQLPDDVKPSKANAQPVDDGNKQAPSGLEGLELPEGFTLPPGLKLPPGVTIPPGFKIPPGMTLPPGLKIPEGMEIPPSLLAGMAGQMANLNVGPTGLGSMSEFPEDAVFGVEGMPMMLKCSVPPGRPGTVVWTAPSGEDIALGTDVVDPLKDRLEIRVNPLSGEYNLMFRYVEFPHDNGTWTCKQFGGKEQSTLFVILAPPKVRSPDVTPANATVVDLHHPWTFTCVAHFAYPPVELRWVRIDGPQADFIQTLPNYVKSSKTKKMSSSIKLIVTPENSGSVFACESRHPAYKGKVYSQDVVYGTPRMGAIVQEQPSRMAIRLSNVSLDKNDTAMVIIICAVAALVFVVGASMYKGRSGWELDVRPRIEYSRVPTSDVEAAPTDSNGEIKHTEDAPHGLTNGDLKRKQQEEQHRPTKSIRRNCTIKVIFGALFSVLLLLSLGLAIPLYLKGVTPPDLGTDMLTSVVAGSALWLDCSDLATPRESVLEITWRRDDNKFYHQNSVMGENVGRPDNSSTGASMGYRVRSSWFGQINIWPVLPGEDGVYSCRVTLLSSNDGETAVKSRTTGVFVITGLFINKALLAVLGIALVSGIGLIILAAYHSLRCVPSTKHDAETASA